MGSFIGVDEEVEQSAIDEAPQPVQPPMPQIAAHLTPQGLVVSVQPPPIQVGLDEATMEHIVRSWLSEHPDLFTALVVERKAALTAQKKELALITNINRSRND